MSLIRKIVNLLHMKRSFIFVYILNTVLLVLISYVFYGVREIAYPFIVSFFLLTVYLIFAAFGHFKWERKLEQAKLGPQVEVDETDVRDRLFFTPIQAIHDRYNADIFQITVAVKERNMLFSQWIHNMKASVSVIALALESPSKEALPDIQEENDRLKQNLEECLNVLRLDDFSRDYMPEKVNLHKVVTEAINAKKRDFIYRGVYPKLDVDECAQVYTDEKWCGYMLEQVLSNAIKYSRKEGKVFIGSEHREDRILLYVRDEGIGIDPEDLPRVFDPFFTGRNGREHRFSTGIGLYMVQHIARKLGHDVAIESEKGAGTKITLSFLAKM
ncbi:sensor histidine kinase [Paenibacillus sp. M1]|uniref:histidine kinase n=1 Tax=Paenibacillus haidiansis TaxID=1574488 RepID=A0ABU7VU81_9BACL